MLIAKKYQTFAGIANLRLHPCADMHGLVRVAIATKSVKAARKRLARFGVHVKSSDFARTWGYSYSAVEQRICLQAPEIPFIAELQGMYLEASKYRAMSPADRIRAECSLEFSPRKRL